MFVVIWGGSIYRNWVCSWLCISLAVAANQISETFSMTAASEIGGKDSGRRNVAEKTSGHRKKIGNPKREMKTDLARSTTEFSSSRKRKEKTHLAKDLDQKRLEVNVSNLRLLLFRELTFVSGDRKISIFGNLKYCFTSLLLSNPGYNLVRLNSASMEDTLKYEPIRVVMWLVIASAIGQNFSSASIETDKSFIGSCLGLNSLGKER